MSVGYLLKPVSTCLCALWIRWYLWCNRCSVSETKDAIGYEFVCRWKFIMR